MFDSHSKVIEHYAERFLAYAPVGSFVRLRSEMLVNDDGIFASIAPPGTTGIIIGCGPGPKDDSIWIDMMIDGRHKFVRLALFASNDTSHLLDYFEVLSRV